MPPKACCLAQKCISNNNSFLIFDCWKQITTYQKTDNKEYRAWFMGNNLMESTYVQMPDGNETNHSNIIFLYLIVGSTSQLTKKTDNKGYCAWFMGIKF